MTFLRAILFAGTTILALGGCERGDTDARTEPSPVSRSEIERDHNQNADRRAVCNHAMYVGEIPLDEPLAQVTRKPKRPDVKQLGREMKQAGIESAQTRSVPAPPPALEYVR